MFNGQTVLGTGWHGITLVPDDFVAQNPAVIHQGIRHAPWDSWQTFGTSLVACFRKSADSASTVRGLLATGA